MKKLFFLLGFLTIMTLGAKASNVSVTLNDDAVNSAINNATEMTVSDAAMATSPFNMDNTTQLSSKKNAWVAWGLCWVVGGFGIHRHYLGTSSMMWLYYCITCGGIFGIVTTVDWVVLLIGAINNDIKDYVNNDSFFMWM